jgi:hypothetical protein
MFPDHEISETAAERRARYADLGYSEQMSFRAMLHELYAEMRNTYNWTEEKVFQFMLNELKEEARLHALYGFPHDD